MGRVHLGRSAGGRTAAVKIVHPHFALDEEFRALPHARTELARGGPPSPRGGGRAPGRRRPDRAGAGRGPGRAGALGRHRLRGRPLARRGRHRRGPAARAHGTSPRRGPRGGAGRGPRPGPGAPGREAVPCAAHPGRPPADRLRHRPGHGRHGVPHRDRRLGRIARLHGPGTDPRRRCPGSGGRLLAGRGADVRGHRTGAGPGRLLGGAAVQGGARGARTGRAERRVAGGRPGVPREGPGGPARPGRGEPPPGPRGRGPPDGRGLAAGTAGGAGQQERGPAAQSGHGGAGPVGAGGLRGAVGGRDGGGDRDGNGCGSR